VGEPPKYKYMPENLWTTPDLKGVDPRKVVEYLLAALSDELLAYHQYILTSMAIKGPNSMEISEEFKKIAEDELNDHFMKLAERLQDYNVDIPDFRDFWNLSRCKQPELPSDPYDIDAWLKAAIEAEECAIGFYREIYDYVRDKDVRTEELIEHIISDEIEHYTLFKNLLSKYSK